MKYFLNNFLIVPKIVLSILLFSSSLAFSSEVDIQNLQKEMNIMKERMGELEEEVKDLKEEKSQWKEEKKQWEKQINVQEETKRELETTEIDREEHIQLFSSYVDQRIERFSLFNTSRLFISGYGAAGFIDADGEPSTFSAKFAPIFHYLLGDKFHIIFEPEFELEDTETNIEVEIAEINIFLNDYLTLVGGKMLLPFNAFSERFHPTWINKMPSLPSIYGHGGGSPGAIIPVMSDIGFQIRGGAPTSFLISNSKINYSLYIGNGPRVEEHHEEAAPEALPEENHDEEEDVHAQELDGHDEEENEPTEIEFGENFTDINSNKAIGGRIGFLPFWNLEIGGSFMFGDAGDNVDFTLLGLDTSFQYRGFILLGEFIHLVNDNIGGGENEKNGYYAQGSYRLSDIFYGDDFARNFASGLEPVVRYGKTYREGPDFSQWALGLNYWFRPSIPIKVAYEINDGGPDRFLLQLAFGF